MTARDLFDVLLRITGVWLLLLGLRDSAGAVFYYWQVSFAAEIVGQYLARATPAVLIGLFLVAGASRVARFFYPGEE